MNGSCKFLTVTGVTVSSICGCVSCSVDFQEVHVKRVLMFRFLCLFFFLNDMGVSESEHLVLMPQIIWSWSHNSNSQYVLGWQRIMLVYSISLSQSGIYHSSPIKPISVIPTGSAPGKSFTIHSLRSHYWACRIRAGGRRK